MSHGSWQNRWKVSVIPDHRIRWTLKTSTGQIRDLDSETIIQEDEWYHIAVTYDGKIFLIYIDGNLESFSSLNGEINSTVFDLEIGQMLPDDQSYNFRGTIDDILIYNQALTPDSIATLADKSSSYVNTPAALESIKAWPNPTTGILNIASDSPGYLNDNVSLRIYDINGNLRKTLEHEMYTGQIRINISDLAAGIYLLDIEANGRKGYQRIVKYK